MEDVTLGSEGVDTGRMKGPYYYQQSTEDSIVFTCNKGENEEIVFLQRKHGGLAPSLHAHGENVAVSPNKCRAVATLASAYIKHEALRPFLHVKGENKEIALLPDRHGAL